MREGGTEGGRGALMQSRTEGRACICIVLVTSRSNNKKWNMHSDASIRVFNDPELGLKRYNSREGQLAIQAASSADIRRPPRHALA